MTTSFSGIEAQASRRVPTQADIQSLLTKLHPTEVKLIEEMMSRLQTSNRNLVNTVKNLTLKLHEKELELKEAKKELAQKDLLIEFHKKEARTDLLSQLANRRGAEESLEKLIETFRKIRLNVEYIGHEKRNVPGCIAYIAVDIDHFKTVNDTYGHEAGDFVIKSMRFLFQSVLRRSYDLILGPEPRKLNISEKDYEPVAARQGGEEFALCFMCALPQHALMITEKLRRSIEKAKFYHTKLDNFYLEYDNCFYRIVERRGGLGSKEVFEKLLSYEIPKLNDLEYEPFKITASLGVAIDATGKMDPKKVLEFADRGAYASKKNGRDKSYYAREEGEFLITTTIQPPRRIESIEEEFYGNFSYKLMDDAGRLYKFSNGKESGSGQPRKELS